jgi:hypothetical protein
MCFFACFHETTLATVVYFFGRNAKVSGKGLKKTQEE